MSTTIDNRVVEMRFDNKQFESATSQSMSTIDKLKAKLNFKGASKSLDGLNTAAKNVNMNGLSNSVSTVQAKFSALQVVGVTALANITNSAINTGKKMISALTIDPIKTGFNEYETKMNSIQTIMSNTASKGTQMSDVTRVIDELNTYADKTIYNFSEMTRNIGTFTAAGVGLEESAKAIQGIANLAAASGSNSQQASTAMYQLSQALATGTVKLMDWNSVVNAGMGGEKFQNALKDTAREHGVAVDSIIEKQGSFRDSLQEGWLSADILNETLSKFTVDGAAKYAKSMMESGKWTKEQADALMKEARAMEDAATKVKTFTQLWDTLKEAAQSGWGKTWELIVGDFDEAKELFSGLSKFFGGIIDKVSNTRNKILEGAMGSPFGKLVEKISGTTKSIEQAVDTVKDYKEVINQIIRGDFGDGQTRFDKLTEAGYDWAHAQNLVNEKLGDSTRHATDYSEAQEKVAETQTKSIGQLAKMTDSQLKNIGYTGEQVSALRELEKQAEKVGVPLDEFVENIDQMNGRTLLIDSFKNAGQGLVAVINSIRDAWRETFYGDASDEDIINQKAESLYNMIAALHKFSTNLEVSKETVDKLKRTFEGLFAIIDIVTTIVGGGFKLAFKGLTKILDAFDMDVLDLTANIGDMIVKFRDFLFNNELINKGFDLLATGIVKAVNGIKQLVDWFSQLEVVRNIVEAINAIDLTEIGRNIVDGLKSIDLSEIGHNIIDGLKNGLGEGISTIPDLLIEIGTSILNAIKGVLGIHSPSTKMHEVGTNAIEGLVNGLSEGISKVLGVLKKIGSAILGFFKNINWNTVFAGGLSVGLLLFVKNIIGITESLMSPLDGLGDLFSGVGKVLSKSAKSINKVIKNFSKILKSFSKILNSFAFSIKAKAIKDIAISLAILVGALTVLTFLDTDKLWQSVAVIGVLAGILAGLALVVEKLASTSSKFGAKSLKIGSLSLVLMSLGAALLMMGTTVKILGSIDSKQAAQGFLGLSGLVTAIGVVLLAFGKIDWKSTANLKQLGSMLLKMSVSLLIMVGIIKIISGMEVGDLAKGGVAILAFVGIIGLLTAITKLAGKNFDKLGGTLLAMSTSMLIMVGVMKLISGMEPGDLIKGGAAILAFVGIFALLALITKIGGGTVTKLGGTLLAMSTSMLIMVGVMKLISGMEPGDLIKGGAAILAFVGIIALLTMIVKTAGPAAPKIATTLLAMSISIGILAGIAILLGLINLQSLAKGIIAVSMLGTVMALMVAATRGAQNCKGSIIAMTVAIAVMSAAVVTLSLLDPSKLAGATAALAIVMGMFALIAKSSSLMLGSMGPLIVMTVAVGLLGGVLYVLSGLPIESTISAAVALSTLLLALSAAMLIVSKASIFSPMALVTIGVMTLVIAALGGILYVLSGLPIESTLGTALALSTLLLALSGACVILAVAGAGGPAALIGVASLAALIIAVGGLMAGIGALVTYFPQLETFLDTGLVLLEKIGYGLGSFLGNIVGGFSAGAMAGLPEIGTSLSMFMTNAMTFITGVKAIDGSVLEGAKALAQTILILTAADILQGIASFMSGGSSMSDFGAQLKPFGQAMVDFSGIVSGNIDEGAVVAAANAGKMLAQMASDIPNSGGVLGFFAGENDMTTFGSQLKSFGSVIVGFSETVSGKIDEGAITAAANAGSVMAQMNKDVPNSGGVISFFTGENDMETFGSQLVSFGTAITSFSEKVSGNIDEGAITAAANAGAVMAQMNKDIPNSGGLISFFTGDNTMETFGSQLKSFGSAIVGFSETVSGNIDEGAITAAANAGAVIATLSDSIPKTGGIKNLWSGDNSMSNFGSQIRTFGQAIVDYSAIVSEVDSGQIASISSSVSEIVEAINKANSVQVDNIDSFISSAKKLGSMKIDASSLSSSASSISSSINSMMKTINSTISSSKSSISSSMKTAMTGAVSAIKSSTNSIKSAMTSLLTALISTITSKKSEVTSAFKNLTSGASDAIRSSRSSMVSAGAYLGDGLVIGINSKKAAARAAGYALGQAAVEGEKAGQHSASPSKDGIKAGKWLGEGLVIGINKLQTKVYQTGYGLGDTASKSMSKAISKISAVIDGGMDIQPRIRPVLDLSNITSGVGTINRMIDVHPSVGVLSKVSSIGSTMNKNQNGAESEVVSAIKDLKKAVGNISGDTYSINGISYDGESDIAEAIQTIVRATRVERRM